ncbi:ATP-binding cassette domain-containing protein [Clostridiaceae bacterium DONG20-135]|uniref:ATP-binding cassette domain-containing protein n=1 Tax=Copranaerobaculum intestinale TaxID=2692629 RepID=A0A6N8UA17_9FIRM|nr:ABC transporter ATP-binding protein [Copranaerobaculum intestinale]MXQ74325.1 ATP-binding cassette domain-containing protein [Copranaerobaculum intestinale]
MRFILHYLGHYKKLILINICSVFGFALVELGIPTIVANMIDVGVMNQDPGYIYQMGLLIVVISVVGVGGTILLGYCSAKISTSITRDIRNDVFDKIQTFSHTEFNRFGISSLITRTNNDAFQIQLFVNVILRTALLTPVMLGLSVFLTIRTSLELSAILAGTFPIIILGVVLVAWMSHPISQKQQKSLDGLNRISRENLTGIRVIRAFNNDAYEETRFNETNDAYTDHSKKIFKLMSLTQPVFFCLMNIAMMLIFWVASTKIDAGTLQIGKLVAFMDYLFHAMLSMMLFCSVFIMYPRAEVSAGRIKEILDTDPLIKNPEEGIHVQRNMQELAFNHVSFVYPDGEEKVLDDISFTAKKGDMIAFIGSTGSGKSTLINLIPRFYDVSCGSITIDGIDIRNFDLSVLRDKIGFIPQKANLFTGTIADNIRFGNRNASDEEMKHSADVAQAAEFINNKPLKYDDLITESGTNVSGGQKQRLSIARAIVHHPQIYIFDDSFSALDFKTDAILRNRLKAETGDAIVLIVAQRVSSIMDASQIIVLNEGRMVGKGTHQELLKACPIYYEIAASQLTKEELGNA